MTVSSMANLTVQLEHVAVSERRTRVRAGHGTARPDLHMVRRRRVASRTGSGGWAQTAGEAPGEQGTQQKHGTADRQKGTGAPSPWSAHS